MSQIQRALRACAETKVTPLTPHWADDARRLMHQAADALDAADEAMAAPAPQAAPVAWCQLALDGRHIAYFDGKPMVMVGPVGNDCHPHPLYLVAAPQTKEPTNDR